MITALLLAAVSCNAHLWDHVYNKQRLHVIAPCTTVTGKVQEIRKEHDGDWHTLLKLDPGFESMLNAKNISNEKGDLVIEPMCAGPVSQQDTLNAKVCKSFSQKFPALKVGNCVKVTGAFVLDTEHGHNEIHPVTSVQEIPCGVKQ